MAKEKGKGTVKVRKISTAALRLENATSARHAAIKSKEFIIDANIASTAVALIDSQKSSCVHSATHLIVSKGGLALARSELASATCIFDPTFFQHGYYNTVWSHSWVCVVLVTLSIALRSCSYKSNKIEVCKDGKEKGEEDT